MGSRDHVPMGFARRDTGAAEGVHHLVFGPGQRPLFHQAIHFIRVLGPPCGIGPIRGT